MDLCKLILCAETTVLRLGRLGLLLAAVAVIGGEPPRTAATAPSVSARPNAEPPINRRPLPPAQWLDSNRGAPNGTQYRTFASKVLGRDVSYLVYLPPGYAQAKQRYPVSTWTQLIAPWPSARAGWSRDTRWAATARGTWGSNIPNCSGPW